MENISSWCNQPSDRQWLTEQYRIEQLYRDIYHQDATSQPANVQAGPKKRASIFTHLTIKCGPPPAITYLVASFILIRLLRLVVADAIL